MTLADIKQKARQSLKDIINRQMDAVETGDINKAKDYAYADVMIFDPDDVTPATV